MTSVLTEITESVEATPPHGWIFYDAACRSCAGLAARFSDVFAQRGFTFAPLQEKWVQQTLGLSEAEALQEMRVLTRDGRALAGADAIVFLARQVWWMWPLGWLARLPGARALLRKVYRWFAAHRHCSMPSAPSWSVNTRWLPLILLPLAALIARPSMPAWGFMWTMAGAIFFGCKWLMFCRAKIRLGDVCPFRAAAYLLAWPGMDAERFLSRSPAPQVATREFTKTAIRATGRMAIGALLLFALARQPDSPLLAGWIGMIGMVLLLHFGFFEIVSLVWRKLRVDAPPIMNAPLRSRSVAEFWGRRWNAAFNRLAITLVFRLIARRSNVEVATMCVFGTSGLVHELVISVPAGAGYGLPTSYFLLQGAALLCERRFGSNRLFTIVVVAAPSFWLFHPPFVRRVIVPFMQTIGAL